MAITHARGVHDASSERAKCVTDALLKMVNLDIAALEEAYRSID